MDERDDVNRRSGPNRWTRAQTCAFRGDAAALRGLLSTPGLDPNVADDQGLTALHLAAREGHGDAVSLLLGHPGLDPDLADGKGLTALHHAVLHDHRDVVALLVARPGVDANRRDDHGATALHYALARGHAATAEMLLERPDLDIDAREHHGGRTAAELAREQDLPSLAEKLEARMTTPQGEPPPEIRDGEAEEEEEPIPPGRYFLPTPRP